jgi:hypothetical protein
MRVPVAIIDPLAPPAQIAGKAIVMTVCQELERAFVTMAGTGIPAWFVRQVFMDPIAPNAPVATTGSAMMASVVMGAANAIQAGREPIATNVPQVITDLIAPNASFRVVPTDSAMMASRAMGNATAARVGWERPVLNVPWVITEASAYRVPHAGLMVNAVLDPQDRVYASAIPGGARPTAAPALQVITEASAYRVPHAGLMVNAVLDPQGRVYAFALLGGMAPLAMNVPIIIMVPFALLAHASGVPVIRDCPGMAPAPAIPIIKALIAISACRVIMDLPARSVPIVMMEPAMMGFRVMVNAPVIMDMTGFNATTGLISVRVLLAKMGELVSTILLIPTFAHALQPIQESTVKLKL